jgi:hypothetical protein
MVKRWHVAFNPETDYFSMRHFWVLLPGLPWQFWNEGALQAIGNSLGVFIAIDTGALGCELKEDRAGSCGNGHYSGATGKLRN